MWCYSIFKKTQRIVFFIVKVATYWHCPRFYEDVEYRKLTFIFFSILVTSYWWSHEISISMVNNFNDRMWIYWHCTCMNKGAATWIYYMLIFSLRGQCSTKHNTSPRLQYPCIQQIRRTTWFNICVFHRWYVTHITNCHPGGL